MIFFYLPVLSIDRFLSAFYILQQVKRNVAVFALLVILFSQLFNLFRFGREVISAMKLVVRLLDNLGLSFGSRWFSFGPLGRTVGPPVVVPAAFNIVFTRAHV